MHIFFKCESKEQKLSILNGNQLKREQILNKNCKFYFFLKNKLKLNKLRPSSNYKHHTIVINFSREKSHRLIKPQKEKSFVSSRKKNEKR